MLRLAKNVRAAIRFKSFQLAAATLLLLGSIVEVQGAVLVSNLGQSGDAFPSYAYLQPPLNSWVAQRFTAGTDTSIGEITLMIGDDGNISGGFGVFIYSNSGTNLPGTLLSQFTGSFDPAPNAAATYTGVQAVSAGTNYWVVIAINPAFYTSGYPYQENWQGTESTGETGVGGWSIADSVYTSINGSAGWSATAAGAQLMSIGSVPEPSRLLLGLLGLAAPLWHRRRAR